MNVRSTLYAEADLNYATMPDTLWWSMARISTFTSSQGSMRPGPLLLELADGSFQWPDSTKCC